MNQHLFFEPKKEEDIFTDVYKREKNVKRVLITEVNSEK